MTIEEALGIAQDYVEWFKQGKKYEAALSQAFDALVYRSSVKPADREDNGHRLGSVLGEDLTRKVVGSQRTLPLWWFSR